MVYDSSADPYSEKMTSLNELSLTAKLNQLAIERERLANGTVSSSHSSSSVCSRKTSFSDISKLNELSHCSSVERFHVNEGSGSSSPYPSDVFDEEDEKIQTKTLLAAGSLIVNTDDDTAIQSPRGTVRGFRNRVRAGIAAFHAVEESESPGFVKKVSSLWDIFLHVNRNLLI